MTRNTLLNLTIAAALGLRAVAPLPSIAGDDFFRLPITPGFEICIGGIDCILGEDDRDSDGRADHRSGNGASTGGRDGNGTADHRSGNRTGVSRDGAGVPGDRSSDGSSRRNTVVVIEPQVRDHRSDRKID